jgi:alpha-galactosidase
VYHQPGLSRVEIWRKTAEMIREVIGDALWMGCGCPLWASVGLVDAVRIGRDVGIQWSGGQSAQSLLRDQATRNFGNQILWQADPDSVLLREQFHMLTNAEVEALAIYAGMSGGVTTTSDHLGQLSEQRMRLWKLILPEDKGSCRFPLLGQSEILYTLEPGRQDRVITRQGDPLVVQVRPVPGGSAVFLLNTGEETIRREYALNDFGLPAPASLWQWGAEAGEQQPVGSIKVCLESHAGLLVWLTEQPLKQLPEKIS